MISVEEALEIVLANLPVRKTEVVFFRDALGRVPAEDLHATCNIPPFNRSSMDGYAVRAADIKSTPIQLELVGEIRAGGSSIGTVCQGQAMAIMTGGAVPAGADAVQNLEQTESSSDGRFVTLLRAVSPGENIVRAGFEAAMGEIVIEAGRVIGPAEIAIMATFGYKEVKIWKRPSVAVMATGDELVDVDQTPLDGQIRNSNGYSLCGQLGLLGLDPHYLGIGRDNKDDLRRRILQGLEQDVLILSGGVSTGKYDFVKEVFEELGFSVLFSKVAMKPGKPTVFARKGDKLIFGLPGNPVATFVAFENFVRPALGRLCGLAKPELPRVHGRLLREMIQTPGRTAYLPAWVWWEGSGWKVDPLHWKGSADIVGFAKANATVTFPHDRSRIGEGETVEAMLLPDFFARRR